ncbi:hypothetical protein SERLA73DRAFT_148949 [Serpula lacrymans var. lacrymans S7.3]|uniref:CxC1-like cysteine cluster associated with KDZ transposases domain-containing protein n=1 Tax=Serpula lacrymans var. lacrymans (strain S7.3) TaxID=936435 RepID=F8PH02_SERL3|nr:hypothetical protein SERLA73DRAFT_148949 [Serpula lacrymans var. lacrymans S7.3]
MVQSGELAKYPLAVVEKLLNTFGDGLAGGFNINCKFKTTLCKSSLREKACRLDHTCLVSAFHGHAHRRLCQLDHLATYIKKLGLEDLEGCKKQAIITYFEHNNTFEVYQNLTRQFSEEKTYLQGLCKEPEEKTLQMEYWQKLNKLQATELRRHALEEHTTKLKAIHQLEVMLNITVHWTSESPKWQNAGKLVAIRKYQRALDQLEGLVVARMFELTKMNWLQTGYALWKHIAKALQALVRMQAKWQSLALSTTSNTPDNDPGPHNGQERVQDDLEEDLEEEEEDEEGLQETSRMLEALRTCWRCVFLLAYEEARLRHVLLIVMQRLNFNYRQGEEPQDRMTSNYSPESAKIENLGVLKPKDYPMIKFRTKAVGSKLLANGPARMVEGVNILYPHIEDKHGVPVSSDHAHEMQLFSSKIFCHLHRKGAALKMWGKALIWIQNLYWLWMESNFEELQYCDSHWKVNHLASYPGDSLASPPVVNQQTLCSLRGNHSPFTTFIQVSEEANLLHQRDSERGSTPVSTHSTSVDPLYSVTIENPLSNLIQYSQTEEHCLSSSSSSSASALICLKAYHKHSKKTRTWSILAFKIFHHILKDNPNSMCEKFKPYFGALSSETKAEFNNKAQAAQKAAQDTTTK